jgi:magnesium chelatase family protein
MEILFMVIHINTVTFQGIEVIDVDLQVHLASGGPSFTVVGLPDKTVAESRERVRAALNSIGLSIPVDRVTINLSPADLPKEGSHFDLPIALGLLSIMKIIPEDELRKYIILGELSLDNSIIQVSGVLPTAIAANARSLGLICPYNNGPEGAWSGNNDILAPASLLSLINHFKGTQILSAPSINDEIIINNNNKDFKDIKGQERAKRAFEITAAGGHNLIMSGPPGTGKSMLASRLPTILPSMSAKEMLETSMIASIAGLITNGKLTSTRPFRSPHHSCSMPAMVGGGMGRKISPGEISLAHNGVLFLDELPEFPRQVLDSLRQPLEEGKVLISRANAHVTFPARFQLIAAMNPCRCGYLGDASRSCNKAPRCAVDYQSKVSGPILDRIDIHIEIPNILQIPNSDSKAGESSKQIATRVETARNTQLERYEGYNITTNSMLEGNLLFEVASPCEQGLKILNEAAEKLKLSMRGYSRILKVARTIADLEGSKQVYKHHVIEAIAYRQLYWRENKHYTEG